MEVGYLCHGFLAHCRLEGGKQLFIFINLHLPCMYAVFNDTCFMGILSVNLEMEVEVDHPRGSFHARFSLLKHLYSSNNLVVQLHPI
jgi:hypothetical protein